MGVRGISRIKKGFQRAEAKVKLQHPLKHVLLSYRMIWRVPTYSLYIIDQAIYLREVHGLYLFCICLSWMDESGG